MALSDVTILINEVFDGEFYNVSKNYATNAETRMQ